MPLVQRRSLESHLPKSETKCIASIEGLLSEPVQSYMPNPSLENRPGNADIINHINRNKPPDEIGMDHELVNKGK